LAPLQSVPDPTLPRFGREFGRLVVGVKGRSHRKMAIPGILALKVLLLPLHGNP